VAIQVRGAVGPIFNDTAFAELYPDLGQTCRKPSTVGLRHRAPPLTKKPSHLARFYVKYGRPGVQFGERELVPRFGVFQCSTYYLVISWLLWYSRQHLSSDW
jgi:hypothetical protein